MSRLHIPKGFRFSGVSAGIKSKANSKDVSLIVADHPCTAAGCFTTNQIVAAPVVYSRSLVPSASVRGVVINSGNANACTGVRGMEDATKMATLARTAVGGGDEESMLVMSTGIIGRFLPMEKIERGIAMATSSLAKGEDAFLAATDGIMTTDAFRKIESRALPLRQGEVAMAGMAKGAGMIGPRMATMLAIVVTDATLSPETARRMLQRAANRSFNRISVEGHMSTNDSLVLLASNRVAVADQEISALEAALEQLCIDLAKKIPDDGEGATHLIEIRVRGAATEDDADQIARTIALSNLVKTAITGGDPNWGRIVSAAGYAGRPIDPAKTRLLLNGFLLFDHGEPQPFDAKAVSQSIRGSKETTIDLEVGTGDGEATHWTSDLNAEYVHFNSEYTT